MFHFNGLLCRLLVFPLFLQSPINWWIPEACDRVNCISLLAIPYDCRLIRIGDYVSYHHLPYFVITLYSGFSIDEWNEVLGTTHLMLDTRLLVDWNFLFARSVPNVDWRSKWLFVMPLWRQEMYPGRWTDASGVDPSVKNSGVFPLICFLEF